MCTVCVIEEEVTISNQRLVEEIDYFLFSVMCIFKRVGFPRGRQYYIRHPPKKDKADCLILMKILFLKVMKCFKEVCICLYFIICVFVNKISTDIL